jgi:hypothetical protein
MCFPVAFGAGRDRDAVASTLLATVVESNRLAPGTSPSADLNFYDPPVLLEIDIRDSFIHFCNMAGR